MSCLTWEKYPSPLERPGPSFLYQELLWFRTTQIVCLWRRKKKNPHELSWYSRERWRGFYRMMRANGEVLKSPIPLQTHLQKYHSHTHTHPPFPRWWIRQSTHLGSGFCTGNWQSTPLEGWRALLKMVVMTDLDELLPYGLWEYNFRGKIWDECHCKWKGLNRINNVYGCRNKNRSLKMFLSSTWS